MKNLKTLGGVLAAAFMLILIPSCTKNLEDYNARTVNKLDGLDCTPPSCNTGDYISMISHRQGANPFFWRGGKHDLWGSVNLDCKQTFSGTNFSNKHYFEITAEGGTVKHETSGRIGVNTVAEDEVNSTMINAGEKLILKLSPCMVGFKMKGFDVTLCARPGVQGVIELYNGESMVKEVAFTFPNPFQRKGAFNYGVSFLTQSPNEYFDKVVFRPIEGRISWVGYQKNLGYNDPFTPKYPFFEGTRFYLVNN